MLSRGLKTLPRLSPLTVFPSSASPSSSSISQRSLSLPSRSLHNSLNKSCPFKIVKSLNVNPFTCSLVPFSFSRVSSPFCFSLHQKNFSSRSRGSDFDLSNPPSSDLTNPNVRTYGLNSNTQSAIGDPFIDTQTLTNVTDAAVRSKEELGFVINALDSLPFSPVSTVSELLLSLTAGSGPFAMIVLASLFLRIIAFPPMYMALRSADQAKYRVKPVMAELKIKLDHSSLPISEKDNFMRTAGKRLSDHYGVKLYKNILSLLIQIPTFIIFAGALRMSYFVNPSSGVISWDYFWINTFADVDPYFVLPVLAVFFSCVNVQQNHSGRYLMIPSPTDPSKRIRAGYLQSLIEALRSKNAGLIVDQLILFQQVFFIILLPVFAYSSPAGVMMYWIISSWMMMFQKLLFRFDRIRRIFFLMPRDGEIPQYDSKQLAVLRAAVDEIKEREKEHLATPVREVSKPVYKRGAVIMKKK